MLGSNLQKKEERQARSRIVPELRRTMRLFVAGTLYYCGVFQLLLERKAQRGEICILGLHRILDRETRKHSSSQDSIVLDEVVFADMLQFLSQHFLPVSMDGFLDGNSDRSRPRCVITFDDGWQDNYTRAYPHLKKHHFPATIFLASEMIDGNTTFWVEQLRSACNDPQELMRVREKAASLLNKKLHTVTLEKVIEYLKRISASARREFLRDLRLVGTPNDRILSWSEVLEMSRNGIDFGSHTASHAILPYEQDTIVDHELNSSKKEIEGKVRQKVRSFAYPNGDWNERVRERVQEAEYECAFATRPGWSTPGQDRYTIPRILLHDGNVTGLDGKFSPAAFTLTLMGWRS
jgi:peptidoglycan/xylan/chitin deacetylase (PgdA/CDA1 family)